MGRVYVDSNVLICLIQDEFGKGGEFMSYRAKEFLDKIGTDGFLEATALKDINTAEDFFKKLNETALTIQPIVFKNLQDYINNLESVAISV